MKSNILNIIVIWLLIIGNTSTLLGLLLIPKIIDNNIDMFNTGAYFFIFGVITNIIGLAIITVIIIKRN